MSPSHAAAALALAVALAPLAALANEDGRQTGRATRGCGTASTCHGVNSGATARIEGPMNLAPGARGTYTLVITSTRTDFTAAGFNIAATGATLAVNGATSRMVSGELTQVSAIPRSGAEVRANFDVVAPSAAGTVTLQAVGNAVDGNRAATNDAWALASLSVAVGAPTDASAPADAVTPTDVPIAGDVGAPADAGPRTEEYDPSASMAYGGCSASPRAGRGGWIAAALLACAALRRRRR